MLREALNIGQAAWPLILLGGGATLFTQLFKRLAKLENTAVYPVFFSMP